jgi:hypothetical protein
MLPNAVHFHPNPRIIAISTLSPSQYYSQDYSAEKLNFVLTLDEVSLTQSGTFIF